MHKQTISRREKINFLKQVASGREINSDERSKFLDDEISQDEVWYCCNGWAENHSTGQKITIEELDRLYPDKSQTITFK